MNELTGPIPPELGNLQRLGQLYLSGNPLTGGVPRELGNFERLYFLGIDQTMLSGRLPRELIGVPLIYFHWDQTDLCAPGDEELQRWLRRIFWRRENGNCSS